jgi:hypothetical protein
MAFAALHNAACIGIVPTKVTTGEVDFRLGSFYTKLYPKFSLDPGDQVQLVLNGAVRDVRVTYGAQLRQRAKTTSRASSLGLPPAKGTE